MTWITALWVALAGCAGALARFVVDGVMRARISSRLALGTMTINISGSLLLGLMTGLVLFHHQSAQWATVGGTGFCGGFTTFSTASFESVRLIEQRLYRLAAYSSAGTLLLTVGAGAIGLLLTRA